MENKIQKKNNSLVLQNYKTLEDELSKILENQKIHKKQQDQILEITQKGLIGIALQNIELLESNKKLEKERLFETTFRFIYKK